MLNTYLTSYLDAKWVNDAVSSPCIDAGDPNSDWTAEPSPNGSRINMGAYGEQNKPAKAVFNQPFHLTLAPLADLASRYNAAFVCIMHLNKGNSSKALYRTQGSLAFPAAARAVWLVSNDPENPESKEGF